jgi:hypothetical protein
LQIDDGERDGQSVAIRRQRFDFPPGAHAEQVYSSLRQVDARDNPDPCAQQQFTKPRADQVVRAGGEELIRVGADPAEGGGSGKEVAEEGSGAD